jgi:hypothetical protein
VQAAGLPFPDALMRWQELERRDIIAGCDGEDAEPLTMDEYLELLALGEVCARHFMQDSRIRRAVTAGASWDEIRAALGHTADAPDHVVAEGPGWLESYGPPPDRM